VEAGLPAASLSVLRTPVVRRLQGLRRESKPISRQVRVVAAALGVTERAVWRLLADAEREGARVVVTGSREQTSTRFTVTLEVRHLFALWKGNMAAVHRELSDQARPGLTAAAARRWSGGRNVASPPSTPPIRPRGCSPATARAAGSPRRRGAARVTVKGDGDRGVDSPCRYAAVAVSGRW
jgi:hypothetical protein